MSQLVRGGLSVLRRILLFVLLVPLRGYRRFISPALPASCRYYPSCATYAEEALRLHGPITGSWLALRRLAR
ncbi:MAG TPA: membrane protein insertion efficiency factor YidD, partial [Actinomycetes bacterium]|nr:membrane protein insertion efficiency factor YidD [Actinomycetes bacterium]